MPERQRLMAILQKHHQDIRALLDEIEGALEYPSDTRGKATAGLRWRLFRLLRSYQLFKHNEIFDPVIKGPDPLKARMATAMKERCIAASESYERHVRKWSLEGVETEWPSYRAHKLAIVSEIRDHLIREGTEAYTLLTR